MDRSNYKEIMDRKKLRIKFVDFWNGFSPESNYFVKILSVNYDVEITGDPDVLIYSCYGKDYLQYNCTRIFYTAENIRPDFTGCDYAISFDHIKHKRHYRLPLFALYIDQIGKEEKMQARSREASLDIWQKKTKFCCMVVSNGESQKRLEFFKKLSQYKKVDSGGVILNNVGGPVKDKMKFISDYRFVLSFENASYPGYTTEKIIEPFMADCIPIYWGDPMIGREFNTASFLCLDGNKSEDDLIKEIISVDQEESKAVAMISAFKYAGNTTPASINKEALLSFLSNAVEADRKPVAQTWRKWLHFFKIKSKYYRRRLEAIILKK